MINAKRFWSQVNFDDEPCWFWEGCIDGNGYGRYAGMLAHRVAYELQAKHAAGAMCVTHTCGNKNCVNGVHLQLKTLKEASVNRKSKLSKNKAEQIRNAKGDIKKLAKKHKVHESTISRIKNNKLWT